MSSTKSGFNIRDLTQHGKGELTRATYNVGKVLPASTTGNLFTVAGSIVVHGLIGVVSTIFSVTSVSPTLGYTGQPAAIAAAPAAPYASTAVGSVIVMPSALGGPLPAAAVASGVVSSASQWTVQNTIITITTGATNTGAVTWLLLWEPLYPKNATTYVTND